MIDITSVNGRENLRATPPYEMGNGEDEVYIALIAALDGLDIAEEMAARLRYDGHTGKLLHCTGCQALAAWDKWKA